MVNEVDNLPSRPLDSKGRALALLGIYIRQDLYNKMLSLSLLIARLLLIRPLIPLIPITPILLLLLLRNPLQMLLPVAL